MAAKPFSLMDKLEANGVQMAVTVLTIILALLRRQSRVHLRLGGPIWNLVDKLADAYNTAWD